MRNSKLIAMLLAVLLLLTFADRVFASTYEERVERGRALTEQINQVRSDKYPLAKKYFLYKVADIRAQERADERDATGTSEFNHNLDPVVAALEDLDVCYNNVAEVVGYSNTLPTSPLAATADAIVDRWEASPIHNYYIKHYQGDWGGGSWAISESGVYFFAYYIVDVCGI